MAIGTFYRHPRKTALRAVIFQVHLWLGVIVGIYAVLAGLTGSILVFRNELQQAASRSRMAPIDPAAPKLPADEAAERMRRAYPDRRLLTFLIPQASDEPYGAYLFKGSDAILVTVHPVTGELYRPDETEMRFWNFISDLHVSLLAGETGHVWNGALAIALAIVLASGLVLWWQGAAHWARGLFVHFRCRWRRVNWDIHSAVGFWALPALLLATVSGIYFIWPEPFRATVKIAGPVSQLGRPPIPRPADSKQIASIQQIVAATRWVETQSRAGRINLSDDPAKAVRVVLYEGGVSAHHRYGYLLPWSCSGPISGKHARLEYV